MKPEEAEDLLSRVKPGQVTVGILPQYLLSIQSIVGILPQYKVLGELGPGQLGPGLLDPGQFGPGAMYKFS